MPTARATHGKTTVLPLPTASRRKLESRRNDAPTDEFRRTLEQVQAAQKAALAVLRPGLPMCDAYAAARRVFEKAGVEKYFTHGLGHGVGLETHEAPSLNPRRSDPLRAGMVVTVEPGLYYPQWGGVRWEHTALITEDGATLF